jgi:chromosome segregation ATPase
MTTESEWLGERPHKDCVPYIPLRDKLRNDRPAPYSMSQACYEIDELRVVCERWADDYQLLAENLEEVRESRERLRIRVAELEGLRDTQFEELREAHQQIETLRAEKADLTAKANYPKAGW